MRKAVFHHLHGAGGTWQGQIIDVDEAGVFEGRTLTTYPAYLNGEKGQVYAEELTWMDEVKPSLGELLDAVWAQEDVVLVDEEGNLTEAGMLYIVDSRRLAAE